ncbi:PAS domain-containing protein [Anabaena sp. UHCC 0204]|uniref:PAS domain-containing protein n=1 Tax=Anabaena sp. UHCC 0204 TaxID=2590009 RepID=UPI0014473CF9|nr:PAS domain-containing protein [Anabaena sp. UHCC 0204]MTJ10034.1 PAS domain S-box protein [Anabaena sp. UHCC 0204]
MLAKLPGRVHSLAPMISSILGRITALIGLVVLLGWIFDLEILKSVLPGLVTMKVNTAVGFLLGGTSLYLENKSIKYKPISLVLAVIVLLLGLLTIIQYGFNINLGIDQIIIPEPENAIATSSPGRMALNTALCFFLLGLALVGRSQQIFNVIQGLALISFFIALFGLVGYSFGIHTLYQLASFTSMALHTSVAFILLSLGILLADHKQGWMQVIMSPYLGGITARRLFPVIIGVPILSTGFFLSVHRNNTLPVEVGFMIRAMVNILVLGGVAWWNAKYLNNIAKKHQESQQQLQQSYEHLEIRVQQRTLQLKTVNDELEKSRSKLSNLINTLPGIVFSRTQDMNWCIDHISDGCLPVTGYSQTVLSNENYPTFQDLIVPEDISKINIVIQQAIDQKLPYEIEYRIFAKNGQEKWLWEKGIPASFNSQTPPIEGFIIDITSLKEAEAALRQSETKFRELAENIHEVFHINTADMSQVLYISPAYQEVWGRSCESLYQDPHSWSESTHPDDYERMMTACNNLTKGQSLQEEYRILRPHGEIRWIFARVYPVYSQSGEILRHVGISEDITKRKQAELEIHQLNEELEQRVQQRTTELTIVNKELESFSYSVSHDLRSPLRAIDGFSQILLDRYQEQLDDKGKHYLTRIRAATVRMAKLIEDMLQLSKVTRSEIRCTQVNLSEIAQGIIQELSESQPERQIQWLIAPDLIVSGDRQLLEIMMENLLNNAWKFTSTQLHPQIELNSMFVEQDNGSSLTYFVRDNGVGFDETYAKKLFQPFQRLHTTEEFPGTGIGLATVQRIISRHGGHIWAKGSVGKGATFYFSI